MTYFGSCYQSARLLSSLWKTYTTERTYWKREAIRRTIYSVFQINVMEDKESMHPNMCATPAGAFFIDANQKGLYCLSRSNHLLLMNIQRNMKFVIPKQQT